MSSNAHVGVFLFAILTIVSVSMAHSNTNFKRSWTGYREINDGPKNSKTQKKTLTSGLLITKESVKFKNGSWRQLKSEDPLSQDSEDDEDIKCEVEYINELDEVVLLCWISDTGALHHHYPINDRSILDSSVENTHVEYTLRHHAFICIRSTKTLPKHMKDVKDNDFVCLYIPYASQTRHSINLAKLTVKQSLRLRDRIALLYRKNMNKEYSCQIQVSCKQIASNSAIIDTSKKEYFEDNVFGFKIFHEPNVFSVTEGLRECLQQDLAAVCTLLPSAVLERVKRDTPFWLDTSISFGPQCHPIEGRSCTYHPRQGTEWLRRMGMNEDKAGSVEIYSAEDYLKSRNLWGVGGLLLHELCHSIHDKYCDLGYDCDEIKAAYSLAMEMKLYDAVAVHGSQGVDGKLAKAYACTNCMEFFAELSVAFLCSNEEEFNKWFPFNQKQLIKHDRETFDSIRIIWNKLELQVAS